MAKMTKPQMQKAVDLVFRYGSPYAAARKSGIPDSTLHDRNQAGLKLGLKPKSKKIREVDECPQLKHEIKELKKQLNKKDRIETTAVRLRQDVYRIKNVPTEIPTWTVSSKSAPKHSPGVPTLLCSDWHWGEVIFPDQIGGVNKFNPRIARERVQSMVSTTIDLLFNRMVKPDYPGLVLALGGDMFSGDIHEELTESNAQSTLESVGDLKGALIWTIDTFLTRFDNIFIPCVAGNHGRMTKKYRAKDMVYTNFDWHIYNLLYDHYNPVMKNKDGSLPSLEDQKREINPRVKFLIGDGSDIQYKIYNHVYNFTHGNQFRGGDGQIGHLGAVIRGDKKKRVRQSQVGQDYDTLLHGHFHSLSPQKNIIGNGSLKGYDEYAYQGNFGFEKPMQALWLTHKDHGITIQMHVNLKDSWTKDRKLKTKWISVPEYT